MKEKTRQKIIQTLRAEGLELPNYGEQMKKLSTIAAPCHTDWAKETGETPFYKGMKKTTPSIELAIALGVEDRSYKTFRYGMIYSYSGKSAISMADGSIWIARGIPFHGTGVEERSGTGGEIQFERIG